MRYTTYEEGISGTYTEEQMRNLYIAEVDKGEYATFEDWKADMLKSGVFEREEEKDTVYTWNSKHDINGNRLNLCVNETRKALWFYGCNCFNLGTVHDGMGIREVNRMYKEFLADGFTQADHATVRDTWK